VLSPLMIRWASQSATVRESGLWPAGPTGRDSKSTERDTGACVLYTVRSVYASRLALRRGTCA
jgi:hypothetical protein